jgi:ferredoxin-NADP reductase
METRCEDWQQCDADDGRPVLLIGGGSCIVPLVSMLRQRLRSPVETPMLLLGSFRTWNDVIWRDELDAIDDPHVLVRFAITRGISPRAVDYRQRIDTAVLGDLLGMWDLTPGRTYVCGTNSFVDAITSSLQELGIKPESIRTERHG